MSAIYLIEMDGEKHLVQAGSKTVAVNHVVKASVTAKSVTAAELVELQNQGLTVEVAGKVKPSIPVEKQEVNHIADAGKKVDEETKEPVAENAAAA